MNTPPNARNTLSGVEVHIVGLIEELRSLVTFPEAPCVRASEIYNELLEIKEDYFRLKKIDECNSDATLALQHVNSIFILFI